MQEKKSIQSYESYYTQLVQNIGSKVGAVAPTITPSAAYGYESAEQAEGIFDGSVAKPLYARVGNPTNAKLESVLATMEGAQGAIVNASGMGSLSMVVSALLSSGDELLCVGGFFGGTYAFVTETLTRFGINNSFCAVDDYAYLEKKLQEGISLVLVESVANPSMRLPDIAKIAALCNTYNTLFAVDNTTTPLISQPLALGADIVVYSSTKNLSGHSAALGGAALFRAVDEKSDKLLDAKYAPLHKFVKKAGKNAFLPIFKKRALRDFGMSASAFNSFLTMLGLETLPLRLKRVNESSIEVATRLEKELSNDVKVYHPSLKSHADHELFKANYPTGCGPLMAIDCGTKERAFAFLNALKLTTQTANIGDNRTLALHMDSTIYSDFKEEAKAFLGVSEGLIRVSIGLEEPNDIVEDFLQAAKQL